MNTAAGSARQRDDGAVPGFTRGSRVRLRPGHGADITDLALAGRTAEVDRIEHGTDDEVYVVVVLDGDPGRDLGSMSQIGHRFFFRPDELEPLAGNPASTPAGEPVLVAGLGDSFTPGGDFATHVIEDLRARPAVRGVHLADFGIRISDLATTLTEGYAAALLLSATPRGREPGTLTVSEARIAERDAHEPAAPSESSLLTPFRALRLASTLGARCPRVVVLDGEPVVGAVDEAVALADTVLADLTTVTCHVQEGGELA